MKYLALTLSLFLMSCSGLPAFLSPSKGVSVTPIGTQIAKEATQQAVGQQNEQSAGRDLIVTETIKEVEAKTVEKVEVNKTNIPPWILLLLLLGWLLPTPQSMAMACANFLLSLFRRTTNEIHGRDNRTLHRNEPKLDGRRTS